MSPNSQIYVLVIPMHSFSSSLLCNSCFTKKLCSPHCYQSCPNIVDLYLNLATGEGVFFPKLCEAVGTILACSCVNSFPKHDFAWTQTLIFAMPLWSNLSACNFRCLLTCFVFVPLHFHSILLLWNFSDLKHKCTIFSALFHQRSASWTSLWLSLRTTLSENSPKSCVDSVLNDFALFRRFFHPCSVFVTTCCFLASKNQSFARLDDYGRNTAVLFTIWKDSR